MPPFAADWAWFLDIDGTLLELEDHPDAVRIAEEELALVKNLRDAASGALALVSGRSIAVLDRLFRPLKLPAAGQHGAERRDAEGRMHRHPAPSLVAALSSISRFARQHHGLVVEKKGQSVLRVAVEAFLATDSVSVERMTKKGLREFDCRAAFVSLSAEEEGEEGTRLELVLRHTVPAVRPDDVLTGLRAVAGLDPGEAPLLTRLAQGPLDSATGRVGDPLGMSA